MDKDAREPEGLPAVLRRWKQAVDEQRGEQQPLPDVLRSWQAARDAERDAWRAYDEAWAAALPRIGALLRRADEDLEAADDLKAQAREILNGIPSRPRPVTAGEIALIREMWAEVRDRHTVPLADAEPSGE